MIQIDPRQTATLRDWFVPDRPSLMVGMHIIRTGNGACFVDRWPNPRAILADVSGNYSLVGDPEVLQPDDLKGRITGFVDAPARFVPLLKETFARFTVWDRVIFELQGSPPISRPGGYRVRRLVATDTPHLRGLSPELTWIWKTWAGPPGLASSGYAWGVFARDHLVSVACSFFLGDRHEDVGVVTEPSFRRLGLSVACAGPLCQDIQDRGCQPSWSTSPDNTASLRVAEKLGFSILRRGRLYVIGVSILEPGARGLP